MGMKLEEFVAAAKAGEAAQVAAYLDERPEEVRARHEGATALHFAAIGNHRAVVDLLLACGAELDSEDDEFRASPMAWANEKGHMEMVRYLAARGAYVDLNEAAGFGLIEHLKKKLATDAARINEANAYGTPLHSACLWGQPEAAETLLAHGADTALKNFEGKTALEIAEFQAGTNASACGILIASRRKEIMAACARIVEILRQRGVSK